MPLTALPRHPCLSYHGIPPGLLLWPPNPALPSLSFHNPVCTVERTGLGKQIVSFLLSIVLGT